MYRLNYVAIICKVGELLSNKDFTQTNVLIKNPTRFYEIQFKGFDFIFDSVDMHIVPARCFDFNKLHYKHGNKQIMKNFKLWGVVTLVTAFLMIIVHLYENVTLYIILGVVLLISLVLTINSIEL